MADGRNKRWQQCNTNKENEQETLEMTWEDSMNPNAEDSKQKQENKQNKRPQDRQDNKNYLEQALIPNDADPIAHNGQKTRVTRLIEETRSRIIYLPSRPNTSQWMKNRSYAKDF